MDALWFGCIPVFLADHYVPPLYDIIPWDTISVSVPESQVRSFKRDTVFNPSYINEDKDKTMTTLKFDRSL